MNLTPSDRALAAGFAGDLELDKGRAYVITVIAGGKAQDHIENHASRAAAEQAGLDKLGGGKGVVSVRPFVERTYEEGAHRFPQSLHRDAFVEATRGWQDKAEAGFDSSLTDAAKWAHNDRMALNLQIDRPDALEQAHRALGV